MPQTVPTAVGLSPLFDYSAFQFDLSLLSDDYGTQTTTTSINATATTLSTNHLQAMNNNNNNNVLKPMQIKQEAHSPRPGSPSSSSCTYASPSYPCLGGELSPNYSRDASPAYPTSPYYLPQSPQSAQLYPTSPEPSPPITATSKPPVKREKSFDLLTILHESRLLAESLGYKEDSTDCTVPCTPPRTEEDIYNSLDADFFPKKDESNPLLKEILFKEESRLSRSSASSSSSSSSAASTCSSSSLASSPAPPASLDYEKSSLRDLLFRNASNVSNVTKISAEETSTALKLDTCPGIGTPKDDCDEDAMSKSGDHQLLREVLRDTSFQRKYNLKPVELGNIGTGYVEEMVEPGECVGDLAREQIEPVLSLAIQQLQKDFDNTCVALGIHPEPCRWSAVDVAAWVQWARRQLQLPSVPLESFNVDGATLASFTEEDFCQRAPQCGSMLHAQLEIWKAAVEESPRNTLTSAWTSTTVVQSPSNGSSSPSIASSAPGSVKDSSNMDYSDDEDDEASPVEAGSEGTSVGKIRSSGSHIHLWQFLKKLLQSPSAHGSCIRWLDRNKGVFKIEDSVRVARLWGKRKNRPAMNYDKLSRSIRQYYKKGIMKKTERSQRLVYQFCHPYCL
ncbi:DNA-binding protein D-ETS-4 isoform X2 [Phymastichus coffea]|nr:DNA-binding protein D-ETS-4 isoform X2 [Phymastichus coffea]